jgi:Helix-turn-helix domain
MRPPDRPGELLKGHRERLGWSTRRAASTAGGNHTYWGQVERGLHTPPRRWVAEAADALGLDAAERDELLAAFGHAAATAEPASPAAAARRRVEEAAQLVGASPAQVAAALAALGIPAADWAERPGAGRGGSARPAPGQGVGGRPDPARGQGADAKPGQGVSARVRPDGASRR